MCQKEHWIKLKNLTLNVNIVAIIINKFIVASIPQMLIYLFIIGESVVTLNG